MHRPAIGAGQQAACDRSKRRRVGPTASEEDGTNEQDDGAFFDALRDFGAKVGVAAEPQQQPEPEAGRRSRRNRKPPDAWWEASNGRRQPSHLSSETSPPRPATPPGVPPSKRKSVRRSLATGACSPSGTSRQSPAVPIQKQKHSAAAASLMLNLEQSASELGLTLRTSTLADVNNITSAHTRFELEMAAWSEDEEPHLADADGIRGIIEDEGGERIILLTREISRSSCELLGFVYSFDEDVQQSRYTGVSAYIAQVWLASSERGQGLGELLLCAAMVSALSRGTQASHLFLCEKNTGARRLYEKSGYAVDGDSGDPVHNLVLVNPKLSWESIDGMHRARQAKQQQVSRTGSRARGGRKAAPTTSAPAPAASAGNGTVIHSATTEAARRSKDDSMRNPLAERHVNKVHDDTEPTNCQSNEEADDEDTTNAVCESCKLPFYTASGRAECVDCRTTTQHAADDTTDDDEEEVNYSLAAPAASPAGAPAAQTGQHERQRVC